MIISPDPPENDKITGAPTKASPRQKPSITASTRYPLGQQSPHHSSHHHTLHNSPQIHSNIVLRLTRETVAISLVVHASRVYSMCQMHNLLLIHAWGDRKPSSWHENVSGARGRRGWCAPFNVHVFSLSQQQQACLLEEQQQQLWRTPAQFCC